jgi:hypothetical protein
LIFEIGEIGTDRDRRYAQSPTDGIDTDDAVSPDPISDLESTLEHDAA